MITDTKQRAKALDISQSFIVQAPAGSGKTELLTQRYLKLLSVCDAPENIIAMTFTNKAVNEMTQRVLSALKSSSNTQPNAPHKQITHKLASKVMQRSNAKGWHLLQNPKRLNISTIDGLYNMINNRYPLLSQLVPRQIMAENWARDDAYQYATEQVLLMIDDQQHGKAIANLLLHLDNNVERFQTLIKNMLSRRDQWLTRLYKDDVLDVEVLKNSAQNIVSQHLKTLHELAEPYFDKHFFALLSSSTNTELAEIKSLPKFACEDLKKWQSIANLCLTNNDDWRKTLNKKNGFPADLKAQKQALIEILKNLSTQQNLKTQLACVKLLPDIDFSQQQADILLLIAQVLKLGVAHLNIYFQHQQTHDFIELALNANQALDEEQGISDISLFLDYKIQHILIDEFQDTSVTQFNTIEKLIHQWQENDGKTLFLVGDPMQSIYRFRESQVGLFLQVKNQGIANIYPKSLTLSANFRSSNSIVEANNKFFSKMFPQENDIYQGAITYSHSQSPVRAQKNTNAISFYPFADNQSVQEAQKVSAIIQTTIDNNPRDTIAVLVRTRSHLKHITQQLKDDNIAFESVEINKLQNHLLTRDLFSLTKALLHLGDKLAWLSILRAPWCGLMLDDLLILSANHDTTIYQQLNDKTVLSKLSQDGQQRAQHLYLCLQDAINNQARFNFVEILTHTINQLGLSNDTLSSVELQIKNAFLHIIHNCEAQQMLDPKTIQNSMQDLYAPSDKSQVKLMTIHSAKGLEFDHVIIPALGKKTQSDKSPIMQMCEFSNQSLLLAPTKPATAKHQNQTYQYLTFIQAQQSKFEAMRLLYVAMTRAKSQLHLLGATNTNNNAVKGSFLHLLMPFFAKKFDHINPTPNLQAPLTALPLKRFATLTKPISKPQIQESPINYQQKIQRSFKDAIGTLVHQYYEQQHFSPSIANIRTRLIEIGIPPHNLKHQQIFITQLLENTKNDKNFNWLFKTRDMSLNEANFITEQGSIAIDRLFIDKGFLWIIDYKTSQPKAHETLSDFIQRQQSQHAKQLLFYKQLMSNIYSYPVRCAIYCPSISQLIEILEAKTIK